MVLRDFIKYPILWVRGIDDDILITFVLSHYGLYYKLWTIPSTKSSSTNPTNTSSKAPSTWASH
jgi:hypothetical protein